MAGLLIEELLIRGDLERCLVVAPGRPGRAMAGRAPRSLKRRLERLRQRLDDERIVQRGGSLSVDAALDRYNIDDPEDLDDAPEEEIEAIEERFVDNATAARTITELEAEISALEPESHRAALRPHPPHRPDRGLPPVEPGRA